MVAPAIMERAQGVILAQWGELLRLRKEVLQDFDPDAIHDLRVASRRFRATLALFEPWLPKHAARLKKSTRKLTRVLGGLRNIDEALLFFVEHMPAGSNDSTIIRSRLAALRPGELARVAAALSAFDHQRLGRTVKKTVARMTEKRITICGHDELPSYFSEVSSTLFQPISTLIPIAPIPAQRTSRHALRIAIKKWRYFFEIVEPILERDFSSVLKLLKEYQTILGRMNDIAEFGMLCGDLKLSRRARNSVTTTLLTEDEALLQSLAELVSRKPLTGIATM